MNTPCQVYNCPCKLAPFASSQTAPQPNFPQCKIFMPPKPKPGVFEDLRRLNFFNFVGDLLTFIVVVLFLLTLLELLVFHYLFSHQPQQSETVVPAETIKEPESPPKEPENKDNEAKINPVKPNCFGKTCSRIDAIKNKIKEQDLGKRDSKYFFWQVYNFIDQ